MNNPLVSIIVPCYNQAQYLDEALQSVLDQTYTNWECIVINDGSPDNTAEVAKKWIDNDSRFSYLIQENSGVCIARNFGISQSNGVYILPLDADDKIAKNYIELAVKEFLVDDSLKIVYCLAEKFGIINGLWNLSTFSLKELALNNTIFNSALFKRADWKIVGGYDFNMIYGREDWEFWIALLKNGGNVKQIDKVGFYYRIKDVSREKNINNIQQKQILEYLSVKHANFYVKQLGSFVELYDTITHIKNSNSYKFTLKLKYYHTKLGLLKIVKYFIRKKLKL